jgi:hypothetical protein
MVAGTPSGAETRQCLIKLLHMRRRRTFHQDALAECNPGGLTHFSDGTLAF